MRLRTLTLRGARGGGWLGAVARCPNRAVRRARLGDGPLRARAWLWEDDSRYDVTLPTCVASELNP